MLGYPVDWDRLNLHDPNVNLIKEKISSGIISDKDLKVSLPDSITYGDIKLVKATISAPPPLQSIPSPEPTLKKSKSKMASLLLHGGSSTKRKADTNSVKQNPAKKPPF
jgi:hypothetical protein